MYFEFDLFNIEFNQILDIKVDAPVKIREGLSDEMTIMCDLVGPLRLRKAARGARNTRDVLWDRSRKPQVIDRYRACIASREIQINIIGVIVYAVAVCIEVPYSCSLSILCTEAHEGLRCHNLILIWIEVHHLRSSCQSARVAQSDIIGANELCR